MPYDLIDPDFSTYSPYVPVSNGTTISAGSSITYRKISGDRLYDSSDYMNDLLDALRENAISLRDRSSEMKKKLDDPLGIPVKHAISLVKKVIYKDPATIVLWTDGTRTVVKCHNEPYDPEKGLAMCILKKGFGNMGNYYNIFRAFLPEDYKENAK